MLGLSSMLQKCKIDIFSIFGHNIWCWYDKIRFIFFKVKVTDMLVQLC